MARDIGLMMLRETLIEARAGRDVAFEEIVRQPWLAKGKTRETMDNFRGRLVKRHSSSWQLADALTNRPSSTWEDWSAVSPSQ